MTNIVLNCLNKKYMLDEINVTQIVLISKVKDLEEMTQFLPICLCSILYKTIVNRLKAILPKIISINQNAFVPNLHIIDNVLVAYELIHALKNRRSGGDGYMVIKLDINKAYDQVEWNFLKAMMSKIGFHSRWIEMVEMCKISQFSGHAQWC